MCNNWHDGARSTSCIALALAHLALCESEKGAPRAQFAAELAAESIQALATHEFLVKKDLHVPSVRVQHNHSTLQTKRNTNSIQIDHTVTQTGLHAVVECERGIGGAYRVTTEAQFNGHAAHHLLLRSVAVPRGHKIALANISSSLNGLDGVPENNNIMNIAKQ